MFCRAEHARWQAALDKARRYSVDVQGAPDALVREVIDACCQA